MSVPIWRVKQWTNFASEEHIITTELKIYLRHGSFSPLWLFFSLYTVQLREYKSELRNLKLKKRKQVKRSRFSIHQKRKPVGRGSVWFDEQLVQLFNCLLKPSSRTFFINTPLLFLFSLVSCYGASFPCCNCLCLDTDSWRVGGPC